MKALNSFLFLTSVGLLGLLPYFLPELFPSRGFAGTTTRDVWEEFLGFLATCFASSPLAGKLIAICSQLSSAGLGDLQAA